MAMGEGGEPEIARCVEGRGTSWQIKAQLEHLDVKSKMASVQIGFFAPLNVMIAESRLSSLVTLYYSFHTF